MKNRKSNMSKAFAAKASLRLADGGVVAPLMDVEDIAKQAGFNLAGQTGYQPPAPSNAPLYPDQPTGKERINATTSTSAGKTVPTNTSGANLIGVRAKDGGFISMRHALRHGEQMNKGGPVHGEGGPREDKVPAMLSNGEYVLPADVVKHIGVDKLDAMVEECHEYGDKEPSLRHYAEGGSVIPAGQNLVTRPDWIPGGNPPPTPVEPPVSPARQGAWNSLEESLNRTPPTSVNGAPAAGSPAAAAMESAPKGALYRAGRFAGGASRVLAPLAESAAIAAPLAGFGDYKIDDPGVDSSLGGTLRAAGNQIKSAFNGTALPADRDASQASLRKGALEAGLDSASGVAKTGDFVAGMFGANPDLAGRMRRNVESDLGSSLQPQAPRVTPVTPAPHAGGNFDGSVIDGYPDAGDAIRSGLQVSRDGNNVSITGDGGPEPTRMQTVEGRQATLRAAYAPTVYNGSVAEDNRASMERNAAAAGSAGGGGMGLGALVDRAVNGKIARREAREQANRDVITRGQDITANTTLRGQNMTAATARNAARIEQMNKDRAYGFDVQKHNDDLRKLYGDGAGTGGGEVGRAEQKARQDAHVAVHKQIESMIPPLLDADKKPIPDTATAARYTEGLNNVLGNAMKKAQDHLALHPEDTKAREWLAKAARDGIGALDPTDIRKHVSGMQTADIAQQQHSNLNPFKGNAPQTSAPVVSLRHKPGFISDDYEVTYGDGSKGIVPARAIDKSSDAIFGMGGQRRSDSDILKQPSLRSGR